MTDCCTSSTNLTKAPRNYACPVNGKSYASVSASTVLHHIKQPWSWKNKRQAYYFCKDPNCEVVYYGQDNAVINKSQLRTSVGLKEKSSEAIICYCFGVTAQQAAKNPETKAFITLQTRAHNCSCATRNPSGKCCLKDFPKNKLPVK